MTFNGGPAGSVLADLFRHVVAHVGLNAEACERLLDQVMEQRRSRPDGDCTLHFTAHAGELQITLSQAGHDWHTTCPVPIR